MLKTCTRCKIPKPADLDHFHRAADRKDGLRSDCKDCVKAVQAIYRAANPSYPRTKAWRQRSPENWKLTLEQNRVWRQRNPEKARLIGQRQHLKRQNWTYEAWQAAMEAQGGICAIDGCGRPAECADHCHASGRRR